MDTSQIALNQSLTFLSWTVGVVVFVVGVFLTKLIIDLSSLSKSLLQTSKILNEELKPTIEELKQTLTSILSITQTAEDGINKVKCAIVNINEKKNKVKNNIKSGFFNVVKRVKEIFVK
jgi:hypothetical protein